MGLLLAVMAVVVVVVVCEVVDAALGFEVAEVCTTGGRRRWGRKEGSGAG